MSLRTVIAGLSLLTCVLLGGPPAGGQPFDLDAPPDSPLWWTLTEGISSGELRATLRDPEGHLERYRAAVEAGLVPPLNEEQSQALSFFVHRQLNPELTPMWFAFEVFARTYTTEFSHDELDQGLASRGISDEGREQIFMATHDHSVRVAAAIDDVRDGQQAFAALQRSILQQADWTPEAKRRLDQAIEERDLGYFATRSGSSHGQIARWISDWATDPVAQEVQQSLISLRQALKPSDWRGLSGYLFEVVVKSMGASVDFDSARVRP